MSEHEYVDLMIEIKDGKIVSCVTHGEGTQVKPLVGPVIFFPAGEFPNPKHRELIERRMLLWIARMERNIG